MATKSKTVKSNVPQPVIDSVLSEKGLALIKAMSTTKADNSADVIALRNLGVDIAFTLIQTNDFATGQNFFHNFRKVIDYIDK